MKKKYFIFSAVLTLAAAGIAQELCYKVAVGNDYQRHCFRADDDGNVYGNAVSDSYCQYSFKSAVGNDYARHCYRADKYGTVYGESVADSYCQGHRCSSVEGCLSHMSDMSDFGVQDLLKNADIRQNDSAGSKASTEPVDTDSAQPFDASSRSAI